MPIRMVKKNKESKLEESKIEESKEEEMTVEEIYEEQDIELIKNIKTSDYFFSKFHQLF